MTRNYIFSLVAAGTLLLGACAQEQREVRDAVDNVKNSVDGMQDKMEQHNQKLQELSEPPRP